jgi:hypothetical protein
MRNFLALVACCMVILSSCNSKDKTKFVKDIPKWRQANVRIQNSHNNLIRLLNLRSIENGFDEFQLRIWFLNSTVDTQQLIVSKKHDRNWSGEFYNFLLKYNNKGDLKSANKWMQAKQPKSGWQVFVDSLLATGIEDLHDFTSIRSGYFGATNPDIVSVEIATTEFYRIYEYPNFNMNTNLAHPSKLAKALELIRREFDLREKVM